MNDPYLEAVVRHVEAGGNPVEMTLALTSGSVVTGFLRRAEFFASVVRQQSHDMRLSRTPVKKRKPETYADAEALADEIAAIFRDIDASDAEAITLSDARVVWSNGDGVTVPTLRIDAAAIAAWWPGRTATPFKGSKDSGAFVGVAIPLG